MIESDNPFNENKATGKYWGMFQEIKDRNSGKWTLVKKFEGSGPRFRGDSRPPEKIAIQGATNLAGSIRQRKIRIPSGLWDVASCGEKVWVKYIGEPEDKSVQFVPVKAGRRGFNAGSGGF